MAIHVECAFHRFLTNRLKSDVSLCIVNRSKSDVILDICLRIASLTNVATISGAF